LVAIVKTAGLLEWYATGSVMAVPALVLGEAVKDNVEPIVIEAFVAGARPILAGTG
jgi:hypothetical protein